MGTRSGIVAIAAALIVTVGVASAQVYAGSNVNGTITQDVNSKTAYVGQPVTLVNVTSANGSGHIIGGKLYGTVTQVTRAGQGRNAKLQINYTKLVLPNGATYSVSTTTVGMQANTKSNALKEVGGAVGGMLVGNAIGKVLFHTGGFGLLGMAGGFIVAKNNHQDLTVPAGTVVSARIDSVTRRQSR